jgi:tetratricopeptide (TPR) repeat protein
VAAARPRSAAYVLTPARRTVGLAAVAPLLVAALVMHVGNRAAAASADAVLADDPAEGVRQAHRAERWEPWSAEGPLLLGQAFLSEGRLAEARASLERAIERDPGDWVSWYALAAASEGEPALRAIARATELNPRSPDVAALRESLRTNS